MTTSIWKNLLVGCMLPGMWAPLSAALNMSQNNASGVDNQFFSADITNNTGVTLDSATLDFSKLFADTAILDWNQSLYSNNGDDTINSSELSSFIAYLKDNNLVTFTFDNLGDVYTKWSGEIGNDGVISLSASGLGADEWNTTETMETFLGIDNSLFTAPATSTIVPITLSTTETITDFATAEKDSLNSFTADGFAYEVVPEPSLTAVFLGLLSLGLVAVRRRA